MTNMVTERQRTKYPMYEDPVNSAPPDAEGYPIRLPTYGEKIFHASSEENRRRVLFYEELKLDAQKIIDRPWWKDLWVRFASMFRA